MSRVLKDSGVERIGKIPENWCVSRTKYVIDIKKAQLPKVLYENSDGKLPYMTMEYIRDPETIPQYADTGTYCNEEDLLLLWDGSNAGEIIFNHPEGYAPSTCAVITIKEGNHGYVKNYMRFLETILREHTNGIGIPHVDGDFLKNTGFVLPPLSEQQKIADYLDKKCNKMDEQKANYEKSIELLKEYKENLITEEFTKLKKSYICTKVKFEAEKISKGETPKDINNDFINNYTHRFLKCENIVDGKVSELPIFTITTETYENMKRSQLQKNDILFVIAGATIGKTAILSEEFLPANTNQAISFIRLFDKSDINVRFYNYFLNSLILKEVISINSVQSAQPNISMEDLGNVSIPKVNNDVKKEIVNRLDKECSKIDKVIVYREQMIEKLDEYKKSLIYECVTGKKEIK